MVLMKTLDLDNSKTDISTVKKSRHFKNEVVYALKSWFLICLDRDSVQKPTSQLSKKSPQFKNWPLNCQKSLDSSKPDFLPWLIPLNLDFWHVLIETLDIDSSRTDDLTCREVSISIDLNCRNLQPKKKTFCRFNWTSTKCCSRWWRHSSRTFFLWNLRWRTWLNNNKTSLQCRKIL